MGDRTAYRTAAQSRILIALAVIYSALWGGVLIHFALADDFTSDARGIAIDAVVAAHLVLVAWFLGYRCGLAGAFAGDDGLVVRNPTSSHHFAWSEIENFSVEPHGAWTMGHVNTKGGDSVQIYGIQGRLRPLEEGKKQWAESPIDQLNALLEERTAQAAPQGQ